MAGVRCVRYPRARPGFAPSGPRQAPLPSGVYYRFLDGRSVINFVKDGWLCGAAGDEIKTLFKIWNLDQYRVDQMQYWIKLDR